MSFIGPLAAIITSYAMVFHHIWFRKIPSETSAGSMNHQQQQQQLQRSKMRALRMLAAVVGAFAIAFLPLYFIFTRLKLATLQGTGWEFTNQSQDVWISVIPLAQWMSSANSCINPFLYHFLDPKFRSRFRQMLLLSRTNSLAATGTAAAATAPSQNRQLQQFTVPLAVNNKPTTNNAEAVQIQISTV